MKKILTKESRFDFLNENGGGYYMVKHANTEEPLYFNCHGNDNDKWWLEAPCFMRVFDGFDITQTEDIEFIADNCMMIFNDKVYEIDLPQVAPFLPSEIELERITETECLEWLIKNQSN